MQNTEYVNDYDDRREFKNGGKVAIKRNKGVADTDRITLAKRFACGGRKSR